MELKMFDQVYEVAENSSVGDLIKANFPEDLKKYLAVQLEDGSFNVNWQWWNEYKEFEAARVIWKGVITLENMRYLKAFE